MPREGFGGLAGGKQWEVVAGQGKAKGVWLVAGAVLVEAKTGLPSEGRWKTCFPSILHRICSYALKKLEYSIAYPLYTKIVY